MAIQHATTAVTTTSTSLTASVSDALGYDTVARSVLLTNTSAVDVFLGGEGVTTANCGYILTAGSEVSLDLTLGDSLYAVVASGTANVRALHTGV